MADETDQPEPLFPLIGEIERPLVEKIVQGVRQLFRRKDVTPEQMHHLAVLLFGLERLPLATPGLHAELSLSCRSESAMHYHSIHLDESTFELLSGGSVYDPNAGSDSFSTQALMVEIGGVREANAQEMVAWLLGFRERVPDDDIAIELAEGCDLDWDVEPDESAWERAASQYREEEPDDD